MTACASTPPAPTKQISPEEYEKLPWFKKLSDGNLPGCHGWWPKEQEGDMDEEQIERYLKDHNILRRGAGQEHSFDKQPLKFRKEGERGYFVNCVEDQNLKMLQAVVDGPLGVKRHLAEETRLLQKQIENAVNANEVAELDLRYAWPLGELHVVMARPGHLPLVQRA